MPRGVYDMTDVIPRYPHNCSSCVFLGRAKSLSGLCDLYFCTDHSAYAGERVFIAHWSDGASSVRFVDTARDIPGYVMPEQLASSVFWQAYIRAKGRGLSE